MWCYVCTFCVIYVVVFSVIAGPNDLVTRKRIERFIEDCGDSVDECSSDLNDLFITKRDKVSW